MPEIMSESTNWAGSVPQQATPLAAEFYGVTPPPRRRARLVPVLAGALVLALSAAGGLGVMWQREVALQERTATALDGTRDDLKRAEDTIGAQKATIGQQKDGLATAAIQLNATRAKLAATQANRTDLVACLRSWLEVVSNNDDPFYGMTIVTSSQAGCMKAIKVYAADTTGADATA